MTFMDDFQKWLVLSGWFKLFLHIVYWWMDRRTDRHCYWLSCYCNWKARVQYSFLSNIFHKACTFKFSWKPCKYGEFLSSPTNSYWRTWVWSYPSSGPHGAFPFIQTPYPWFLNCLCLCFIISYVVLTLYLMGYKFKQFWLLIGGGI